MDRVLVNVAVREPYTLYQQRLLSTLLPFSKDFDKLIWTSEYPKGSPGHQEVNYAFKVYALKEARELGYTKILWVDAAAFCLESPAYFFDKIAEQGYYFYGDDNLLGAWCSDYFLDMVGHTRDEFMDSHLLSGTIYGFDLSSEIGSKLFNEYTDLYDKGSFMGAYINDSARADVVHNINRDKSIGNVSGDPRCKGHRHDESTLGYLVRKYGCRIDFADGKFQGSVMRANKW